MAPPDAPLSRRAWLVGMAGAATTGALGGFGCGDNRGGAPDARALDGATCRPTRADIQGPFFLAGAPTRMAIADAAEPGERLALRGRVLAADCVTPLANVDIEVWQADRDGAYHDAADDYRLRGRLTTDADGRFEVLTIRPGNYLQGAGYRPAHVHFTFAHAAHRTLTTQIYFAGDAYLAPADSCDACGSDDADRIVTLAGDAAAGWTGELRVVLAAA